jgi:hypothetical protein
MGREAQSEAWAKLIGGEVISGKHMCKQFSWLPTCSENGDISMIWGWSFWLPDVKKSPTRHPEPREDLVISTKMSLKSLKSNLGNHYNPHIKLGTVVHTCNPSTQELEAGRSRPSWAT